MQALELKIPPPAVAILCGALMWLAAEAFPAFVVALPYRNAVAMMLALVGIVTALLGVAKFWRARTTVNPHKPESASALVTTGIYRVTRNPMYLGLALALIGWGAFLANALALALVPAFLLYIGRFQIAPEERALAAAFGEAFAAYRRKVRRWL
jgi:protein-S-isoprenylcysteine O-methyltransferase Ste14